MKLQLNLVDQLIVARVQNRFASSSRRATPIDLNDYSKALRSLKAVDPLLGGLKTTSDRYKDVAKKALDKFESKVEGIPTGLEQLGVDTKGIKRFHTQLLNLIRVAKKGHPLRAYSTFTSDSPLGKVRSIIISLGKAALKSSGAGAKVLKPALVANYLGRELVEPFEDVKEACDGWFNAVDAVTEEIHSLVMEAGYITPVPSGFNTTPEFESYTKAQREFTKESKELTGIVIHNVLGLALAGTGFEDCVDVELCISTASKSLNEAVKIHTEFGKKWGDFRAQNQDQESGQRSLFARSV